MRRASTPAVSVCQLKFCSLACIDMEVHAVGRHIFAVGCCESPTFVDQASLQRQDAS